MTGKDLIIYILENNLVDKNLKLDLLTTRDVAIRFNVGEETVITWHRLKLISGIEIGGSLYFLQNVRDPRNKN